MPTQVRLESFGVPGLYGSPEERVFYLDVRELAHSRGEPEDDESLRALADGAVNELKRRIPNCWPIRILEDAGERGQ